VAAGKRGSHGVESTEGLEGRGVAEGGLLGIAESIGDGVAGDTLDSGVAVLENNTVLDIEALDVRDFGAGADELSDNGHLLGGIESHARAVEVLDTHAVAL
jgi:hypothetical protein